MNMPLILLYNLDTPKGAKIRRMCLPLGLRTRLVTPEEYGLPLGDLVDGAAPETPWTGFRRNKIPAVYLKAVLTPTNRIWNSVALHGELVKERQAIAQGQGAHAGQTSGEEGN